MANRTPFLRQQLRIAPIQKLTLTPALLQKIELLTLSHLELSEFIKNELLQNPLLDEGTENTEEPPAFAAAAENRGDAEAAAEAEIPLTDQFENVDYGAFFDEYLDAGRTGSEFEDYEKPGFETFAVKPTSLYEHLLWQLGLVELRPEVERAAREIIGNLDREGYLKTGVDELARTLGCGNSDIEEALKAVQQFDPPGVAARDLKECLLVQLRYWDQEDTLAGRMLTSHSDFLESGNLQEIARLENCPLEEVQEQLERIRHLNPKPGLQYQSDTTIYIQPDVYIYKMGHNYVISLNEDGLPRLHINPYYRRILEKGNTHGEEKRFIREKFKNAIELIRNLDHRKRTIYRVCEIVVERQRDFLDKGFACLKPMLLKDVAEELGLHTSTISRAVTNKWAHCPQGILELRQFFTLGFKTDSGEDMSVYILKSKIKDLIDGEAPSSPLSDSDLTDRLNRGGVEIKRRTVAKYREEMGVPNSRARRTEK